MEGRERVSTEVEGTEVEQSHGVEVRERLSTAKETEDRVASEGVACQSASDGSEEGTCPPTEGKSTRSLHFTSPTIDRHS